MIEIENLTLDEWLNGLKPYQRNTINYLISAYGTEKAAEEWINARGPIQTVTFGGVSDEPISKNDYWKRFKNEFDKLICGHPDYQDEHDKFVAAGKPIGLSAISCIASLIAESVGMSPALLIPAVVLLLSTTGKMGVKAYCVNKNFDE